MIYKVCNFIGRYIILRIRIPLSDIAYLSSCLRAASVELSKSRQTLARAAARLDWEVSRRPEIDSMIHRALAKADLRAEEAFRLSEFLKLADNRFQGVDSQFIFKVQALPDLDNQNNFALKSYINSYSIVQSVPIPQASSLDWIKGIIT